MSKINPEAAMKKKLQVFLADLVKLGTTQGFKHFSCYIRGKEELIISIKNSLPASTTGTSSSLSRQPSRKQSLCYTDSLNSSNLPYDRQRLTLSHNTQVGLSGWKKEDVGLPPASPSELEEEQSSDVTNFLIAGYGRYMCPYVWIRSNHERLMRMPANAGIERDSPLRLKSAARWQESDVYVFEVVAELVKLCMYPVPRNPFEVDFKHLHSLAQPFQYLATAGLISFLDRIITHTNDNCPYSNKVFEEHQLLAKLHFSALHSLVQSDKISILKHLKNPQDKKKSSSSSRNSRNASSSSSKSVLAQPSSLQTFPPSYNNTASPPVRSTYPINASPSINYYQGSSGAFPGGFERMPAPSMF